MNYPVTQEIGEKVIKILLGINIIHSNNNLIN